MGFSAFSSPYDWSRVDAYRASAARAEGGLIDLSVGSPVDAVAPAVGRALADAADAPHAHGYPATAGTRELREAVGRWFALARHVDLHAVGAQIVPTVGSKEAVALMASLMGWGDGDVVVQPKVSYPTYAIGTQLAGAAVREVENVADVDSWVRIPGVRAVWVNSPSNPTGSVLEASSLSRIVEAARSIGAVVLSDECYALMRWDGGNGGNDGGKQGDGVDAVADGGHDGWTHEDAPSVLRSDVCHGDAQGVLALYSLSKQSNMAGYRTAFIAGDASIVDAMTICRKQVGQIIPGPVQAAMASALGDLRSVDRQWHRYRHRLEALVEALRGYGYEASMPQGALYVWTKALGADCWQDMENLSRIGIIASPGEFYGAPGYLRFSVTATDADIERAVGKLRGGR